MTGLTFRNRLPWIISAALDAAARPAGSAVVGGYRRRRYTVPVVSAGVGVYRRRRYTDPAWVQQERIEKAEAKRSRRRQRNIINAKMGGYYG